MQVVRKATRHEFPRAAMHYTQNAKEGTKSILIVLYQKVNWNGPISNTHRENNDTGHTSKVVKQINGRVRTQSHGFRPDCMTSPWQMLPSWHFTSAFGREIGPSVY